MSQKIIHIDIEIDKLTNSIENRISGEVFDTDVVKMTELNLKHLKKKDWLFNWQIEIKSTGRKVYKLTTLNNPKIIQGLISLEDRKDHIFIHLIESAKFNIGKNKLYLGVPGNLVAFACKYSFEKGYEGFVVLLAKTKLIDHYTQTLRARILYHNYMAIDTKAARILVERYYNK